MPRIASSIDSLGDDYRRNRERMTALTADLEAALDRVRDGGGADAMERHRARGKLPVRERIE